MDGADFSGLNRFSEEMSFQDSSLNYAIFEKATAARSEFKRCSLCEAAFYDADLHETCFDDSDLSRAVFDGANLTSAIFAKARNFSINPKSCLLKKTVFSEHNIRGLVDQLNIILED